MRRDVRILLVGDGPSLSPLFSTCINVFAEGVGKSTIVTSLIKESFVAHVSSSHSTRIRGTDIHPQVQHVVPEVTIPPEVTPENVTTYIVDSGGLSQNLFIQSAPLLTYTSCTTRPTTSRIRSAQSTCYLRGLFNRQPSFI